MIFSKYWFSFQSSSFQLYKHSYFRHLMGFYPRYSLIIRIRRTLTLDICFLKIKDFPFPRFRIPFLFSTFLLRHMLFVCFSLFFSAVNFKFRLKISCVEIQVKRYKISTLRYKKSYKIHLKTVPSLLSNYEYVCSWRDY